MKKFIWPLGIIVFSLLSFFFSRIFFISDDVETTDTDLTIYSDTFDADSAKVSTFNIMPEDIATENIVPEVMYSRKANTTEEDSVSATEMRPSRRDMYPDSTYQRDRSRDRDKNHRPKRKPSTGYIISSITSGVFSLIGFGWTCYGIRKEIKEKKSKRARLKARAKKRASTGKNTKKSK